MTATFAPSERAVCDLEHVSCFEASGRLVPAIAAAGAAIAPASPARAERRNTCATRGTRSWIRARAAMVDLGLDTLFFDPDPRLQPFFQSLIKSGMATKSDIATLGEQLASIESELKAIRCDLDDLAEKFKNFASFQKEIDHALEPIGAIEKHLGINKKIAA
jgi:hypothetical protein